jgi:pimeloyl-ACP methyl ester carboxylesterase
VSRCSPAPASIASSDDVLAAVLAFVDETIGVEPFLVIGESYGGYLARAVTGSRAEQVLGLGLICPVGTQLLRSKRTLPAYQVLRPDAGLLATLEPGLAEDFADGSVVQTAQTLHRFREEVVPGLELADTEAIARIEQRWPLSVDPESEPPFARPSLILTGRVAVET